MKRDQCNSFVLENKASLYFPRSSIKISVESGKNAFGHCVNLSIISEQSTFKPSSVLIEYANSAAEMWPHSKANAVGDKNQSDRLKFSLFGNQPLGIGLFPSSINTPPRSNIINSVAYFTECLCAEFSNL